MPRRVTSYRAAVAAAVAIAIASSAPPVRAQAPLVLVPVRTDRVMSAADRERTGVAHLTPEQRIALDGWLTRYTAELRRAAGRVPTRRAATSFGALTSGADGERGNGRASDVARAADASSLSEASGGNEPPSQRAQRRRGRAWLLPFSAPPGAPLAATPEDGGYVRLADGTLWEVYLPDRTATVVWRRGDYIAVSRAAAGVGEYDHVLVNAPARTRAFARFAGLVPQRRR